MILTYKAPPLIPVGLYKVSEGCPAFRQYRTNIRAANKRNAIRLVDLFT